MAPDAQRERPGPDEQLVELLVQRIVAAFRPVRVILFGSRARGTAKTTSDVDLLVVLPEVSDKRQAAVEMRRLLRDMPVTKDIVVTTPDEITRRANLPGNLLPEGWSVKDEHPDLTELTEWAVEARATRATGRSPPTVEDADRALIQARGVLESVVRDCTTRGVLQEG